MIHHEINFKPLIIECLFLFLGKICFKNCLSIKNINNSINNLIYKFCSLYEYEEGFVIIYVSHGPGYGKKNLNRFEAFKSLHVR